MSTVSIHARSGGACSPPAHVGDAHMAAKSATLTIFHSGYGATQDHLNLFSPDPAFWRALAQQAMAAARLLNATQRADASAEGAHCGSTGADK